MKKFILILILASTVFAIDIDHTTGIISDVVDVQNASDSTLLVSETKTIDTDATELLTGDNGKIVTAITLGEFLANTKAVWHMANGSDDTGNGHTMTPAGPNGAFDTSIKKFGTGSWRTDSDTYLTTPDAANFYVSDNDFTIEGFIYCTDWPEAGHGGNEDWGLLTQWSTDNGKAVQFAYQWDNGNSRHDIQFLCQNSLGTQVTVEAADVTLVNDTWYHVAACRSGDTIYIYLDGESVGALGTGAGFQIRDSSEAVNIGAFAGVLIAENCYFDEWRFVNGTAVYPGGLSFDPPTQEFGSPDKRYDISDTVVSTDGTLADDSDTAIPTEKAVKTYVDGLNAGWLTIDTDSYTATPTDTDTLAMSDTSYVTVGSPLKYTLGLTAHYGQVVAVTTDTSIDVIGASLSEDVTALAVGPADKVQTITLFVSGTYGNGTDTDLLANDMNTYLTWKNAKAYCVGFSGVQNTIDTGTEPKINIQINNVNVSTADSNNGIQLSTAGTWVSNSPIAISTANYDINYDEEIEVNCTAAGGTGDASDLTVTLIFVAE